MERGDVVTVADAEAPLFFLSYASSSTVSSDGQSQEAQHFVERFFEDLSENVAELVATPPGSEPGFMDRSIAAGARRQPELLRAVGTCQVFVALLSNSYVRSSWCGREWHAFSQRRVTIGRHERGEATTILPVVWTPFSGGREPSAIRAIQRFWPRSAPGGTAENYDREGIYGLLRHDLISYQITVWRLAVRIAELHYTSSVEPMIITPDQLYNAFAEHGA